MLGPVLGLSCLFLPFPLVRLLIHVIRCRKRFDADRAKRIALWNSLVVGATMLFCFTVDGLICGVGDILTATLEGAYVFSLCGVLCYWINRTLLTRKATNNDV